MNTFALTQAARVRSVTGASAVNSPPTSNSYEVLGEDWEKALSAGNAQGDPLLDLMEALIEDKEALILQNSKAYEEKKELVKEITAKEAGMEASKSRNRELNALVVMLMAEKRALQLRVQGLEETNEMLVIERNDAMTAVEDVETECDALQAACEGLEHLNQLNDRKMADAREFVAGLMAETAALESKCETLKQEMDDAVPFVESLIAERDALQYDNERRLASIETTSHCIDVLKGQKANLEKVLEEVSQVNDTLFVEKEALEGKLEETLEDLHNTKSLNKMLEEGYAEQEACIACFKQDEKRFRILVIHHQNERDYLDRRVEIQDGVIRFQNEQLRNFRSAHPDSSKALLPSQSSSRTAVTEERDARSGVSTIQFSDHSSDAEMYAALDRSIFGNREGTSTDPSTLPVEDSPLEKAPVVEPSLEDSEDAEANDAVYRWLKACSGEYVEEQS